jgi:hypothetical protein
MSICSTKKIKQVISMQKEIKEDIDNDRLKNLSNFQKYDIEISSIKSTIRDYSTQTNDKFNFLLHTININKEQNCSYTQICREENHE